MKILKKVISDLEKLSKDPKNLKDYSIFHKDGKEHIGLTTSLVRKASAKTFQEIKNLSHDEILFICEQLLKSKKRNTQDVAFDWAFRIKKRFQKKDFRLFERWLKNHVSTWGGCDDLCTHALGDFLYQFPDFLPKVKKWAKSTNKWLRRASAVSLIYSLRRGKYLKESFETAIMLMVDKEDLVQKGYGWMLKEATKFYQNEVFDFVMKNRSSMSRIALRYAIEKMPANLKRKAMVKDF